MKSLGDLLGGRLPQEPEEVAAIKHYISQHFQSAASVGLQNDTITITVASASLANMLRLHRPKLQAAAGTTKRLVFRIG